ncbi:MAG: hypothetical protein HY392_00865 [Candidatus Diapherotrites archaeon]|nr:hypothetical protein [Candidatus Diapherotrites archaeon]
MGHILRCGLTHAAHILRCGLTQQLHARAFLLLFFAVFLPFFAAGETVFVSIEPVEGSGFEFYSFEVVRFRLIVSNNSGSVVENFNAVIFAGNDLTLVVDGAETRSQKISFLSIAPGETLFKEFQAKGLFSIGRKTSISVDYGVGGELSQSYSADVSVKRNPVEFNARLLKGALEPFEANSVVFDLKNTGETGISTVRVEAFLPQGFSFTGEKIFSPGSLAPQQSILNARLDFSAGPEPVGEQNVTVKAFFSDGTREHEISKTLLVDVRKRENTLVLLGLTALVIAALVIFFGRKKTVQATPGVSNAAESHAEPRH